MKSKFKKKEKTDTRIDIGFMKQSEDCQPGAEELGKQNYL